MGLAAARNSLYESPYMVSDMLRDRRRGSMAENNFQLRVRKRGSPESNFQLRGRKDFLDRLRASPQIRSSAEENFQFRVRRSDPLETYQRSLRQTLLDKIRDRRFNSADHNFQLRVRRSPEFTTNNADD